MAKRITEHLARTAKLPKGKSQVLIWDTEVKGFGLRVTAKQASFILQVSLDGSRKKRITIGRWPEWHVDEARERARHLKHDDIPLDRPRLVVDAWKRYADNHLPKLARKTAHDRGRAMEQFVLPVIGKKALAASPPKRWSRCSMRRARRSPAPTAQPWGRWCCCCSCFVCLRERAAGLQI